MVFCYLLQNQVLLVLMVFPARPTRYALPAMPLAVVALAPIVTSWIRAGIALTAGLRLLVGALGVLGGVILIAAPWLPAPWSTPLSALAGSSLALGIDGVTCFGIVLGVLPWLVHTRRQLVVALLLLPIVAAHTLGVTHQARAQYRPRFGVTEARWLERQARELSVEPGSVATWGHVPPELGLGWSAPLPGDEFLLRVPEADWLVVESPDREVKFDASVTHGYVDRVRLRARGKSVVLRQRSGLPSSETGR